MRPTREELEEIRKRHHVEWLGIAADKLLKEIDALEEERDAAQHRGALEERKRLLQMLRSEAAKQTMPQVSAMIYYSVADWLEKGGE